MIVLLIGASHTGKTALAQRLLERYQYPYLSIDHLKMGLIRAGYTGLTPMSEEAELTAYLWPVVREMIKTAIENKQNLIVEGCYIPFDWAKDFTEEYRREIHYYCLVMSEDYIRKNFANIRKYASIVEDRQEDEDCTMEWLLEENARFLEMSSKYGANQILIHDAYAVDIHL
ncbi:MAG: adenylate kinase [Clostridia bacterium]|nr:adenylate kinase [Clostridia bacterium]